MTIALRLLCGMILAGLVASGALAQEPDRQWPSGQQAAVMNPPEDPPLGRGGRCRHEGERIDQGETQCLTDAAGTRYLALCGMSLNNTSWLPQEEPCAE